MTARGFSWVGSDHRTTAAGRVPDGALYVQWEEPDPGAPRIVLVHGGGGQGTDWLGTPDGRPGWAALLVEAGWAVHVVDRPGHGRAAGPGAGELGPPPGLEAVAGLFTPGDPRHTRWPGPGGPDDPAIAQLAASSTGLPVDGAAAQARDARRLAELLERIGPAVLVAHSMGAPAVWLAAAARPELVRAVVALEPPGPPFLHLPQAGVSLPWGLTTAPMEFAPPVEDPEHLQDGRPRSIPGLVGMPIAVVEAEASPLGGGCALVAQFLRDAGAAARHLALAEHGVTGNGHGMVVERNHADVLDLLLRWLADVLSDAGRPTASIMIKEHQ
ncbi:alpha/beta fold hydrolase [Pseudonocardia xishanensis]|uniref:AB hydrolase-1 domain-containing protein n=1 Tax=Pseudonocardia xishanensis TaxID=630995 RepID=A0ABP8RPF7_9PSEU